MRACARKFHALAIYGGIEDHARAVKDRRVQDLDIGDAGGLKHLNQSSCRPDAAAEPHDGEPRPVSIAVPHRQVEFLPTKAT